MTKIIQKVFFTSLILIILFQLFLLLIKENNKFIETYVLLKGANKTLKSSSVIKNNNDVIDFCNSNNISSLDIDVILNTYKKKDFLDVIFNRNTCKNFKYGPEIPDAHIELILRSAMTSPSGFDFRTWHFIVIKDKQLIQKLLFPIRYDKTVGEGRLNANLMIVVCQNKNLSNQSNYTDACLSSLLILLSAEYLGYAAAYVDIAPSEDKISMFSKQIQVPQNYFPFNMVLVGYYEQEKIVKNKFDLNKIYFENIKNSNIGKSKILDIK